MEPRPQLSAPRNRYSYFPGNSPVPEWQAVNTKNRSFVIGADVWQRSYVGSRKRVPGLCTIAAMAYDEALAERIRELVAGEHELTEKQMFGGLAFLIGGNMAVAASGQGGMMVRVDPAMSDELVATTDARLMEMRGRPMQGWLRVRSEHLQTRAQLAEWVTLGTTYARTLPSK
jgi:TfoX/Sxy family transcriptional regulator of competence genes